MQLKEIYKDYISIIENMSTEELTQQIKKTLDSMGISYSEDSRYRLCDYPPDEDALKKAYIMQ